MKKIVLSVLILAFTVNIGFGQHRKFQVSIFGGVNHVFEFGSVDDYVLGENDFPVTPAHTPANMGVAFAYFFTNNIGIELDGRYTLSSKVTLEDPSDQDTVKFDTSMHYSVTINFLFHFLSGKFRPYLIAGGGVDKLLTKDETYTSEYGYEIDFLAPKKKSDPVAQVGAGVCYYLAQNLGIRLDFRYVLIFDEPNNVNSLNIVFGLFLRL
jgi:outer membrane beta-barrel protein